MAEFFKAALPWVIMAFAIILFSINHAKGKQKQPNTEAEKKKAEDRQTEGMCIGMCFGAAWGAVGICNLATGISLGMLIGMAVGMCIKK